MDALAVFVVALIAYAVGSLSPAQAVARAARGVDLRVAGSGNLGARNAARVLGPRAGAVVLVLDVAKGWLVVFGARQADLGLAVEFVAAFAAVLGHVHPPWYRFRGGKGAACALGASLALEPRVAAATVGAIALGSLVLRDSLRAGLIAFAATPLLALAFARDPARGAGVGALALFMLWTHREDLATAFRRGRIDRR